MPDTIVFSIAIIFAAFAGLSMVIGGIVLIYKGALVLASTDPSVALDIQWKQDFRLSTQAPGIAFFIIGLLFSIVAIIFSKPQDVEPIQIQGKILDDELANISQDVKIRARSSFEGAISLSSSGEVSSILFPHVKAITLEVSAPGYKPFVLVRDLSEIKNRTILIEQPIPMEQELERIVGRQIRVEVDDNVNLAPLGSSPSFGSAL